MLTHLQLYRVEDCSDCPFLLETSCQHWCGLIAHQEAVAAAAPVNGDRPPTWCPLFKDSVLVVGVKPGDVAKC